MKHKYDGYLKELLARNGRIAIVSGNGEFGAVKLYDGERTLSAIGKQLKAERANGAEWATAVIETMDADRIAGYAVKFDERDLEYTVFRN